MRITIKSNGSDPPHPIHRRKSVAKRNSTNFAIRFAVLNEQASIIGVGTASCYKSAVPSTARLFGWEIERICRGDRFRRGTAAWRVADKKRNLGESRLNRSPNRDIGYLNLRSRSRAQPRWSLRTTCLASGPQGKVITQSELLGCLPSRFTTHSQVLRWKRHLSCSHDALQQAACWRDRRRTLDVRNETAALVCVGAPIFEAIQRRLWFNEQGHDNAYSSSPHAA